MHWSYVCYTWTHCLYFVPIIHQRYSKGYFERVEVHPGTILCMHPANERQRYNASPSLIGWGHTQNDPFTSQELWKCFSLYCGMVLVDFTHILQGCFSGAGAIIRLPQRRWSNPEEWIAWHRLKNKNMATTKRSMTKMYAYFMGCTVVLLCLQWNLISFTITLQHVINQ